MPAAFAESMPAAFAECVVTTKNAALPNCGFFVGGASCAWTRGLLDSLARRARSASRTKPSPRAVGGSRRSTRSVDESEIGSANETATLGSPFRFSKAFRASPLLPGQSPSGDSPYTDAGIHYGLPRARRAPATWLAERNPRLPVRSRRRPDADCPRARG